ncbi:MAG TPA: glycosyltransferase family 39 protein [Terriglobales bacterium]|nr:glycosyltransferase family 39 protein [Terriglobales bacterium]
MKAAVGLPLAIGVSLLAQWCFDHRAIGPGLALATATVAVAAFATRGVMLVEPALAVVESPSLTARRWGALLTGIALAALGVAGMEPNAFTLVGTLAWLAGLALCLLALVDHPPGAPPRPADASAPLAVAVLAAIVAAGAVFRFYLLTDLPAEAGCDIPLKLEIVRGMLSGERPIYSPVYPGREVGFFYATALYGAVFGADQPALKVVSALISVATIAALYGLGARWFGRVIGLAAAAALALSTWHVTLSRIGYRGVLTPLMVVAALAALDRALARGARRDWTLVGAIVGACVYTYTAALAIGLAVVGVGFATFGRRDRRAGWATALLVTIVVALPMTRPLAADFDLVSGRARDRIAERVDYVVSERLRENTVRSLGGFNVGGDSQAILNVPFRRQLGFASGALFLCGLGIAAGHWRQRRSALLLVFLFVMQVPSILALANPIEVPAALRASGCLIPVCLLIGLPLPLLWRALRAQPESGLARAGGAAVLLLAAVLLVGETGASWQRYFVDYPGVLRWHNYPLSRTIAAAMDAYAGQGEVYLANPPSWLDGKALRAQLQRLPLSELHELGPVEFDAAVAAASPPFLAVLRGDETERTAALRARFPAARAVTHTNVVGEPMLITVAVP